LTVLLNKINFNLDISYRQLLAAQNANILYLLQSFSQRQSQ